MKTTRFYCGIIFSLLYASNCIAQVKRDYDKYVDTAEIALHNKDYAKAAHNYSKAFFSNNNLGRIDHRYRAAQCWALVAEVDSAFYQLNKVAKFDYLSSLETSVDTALILLRKDPRWIPLLALIKENEFKDLLNKPIAAMLDTIHFEDQSLRKQMDEVEKRNGRLSSTESNYYQKIINEKDAINLVKVEWILNKYGWLGKDDIGMRGNSTLFLVIQHADLPTQIKYLPMMMAAVKQGKANASSLAYLEDRIALRQGKKQIYGSQIGVNDRTGKYYVFALEDPENVDKRRLAVGLGPMKDYVIQWGIIWSVDQYNRDLKEDNTPRTIGELKTPNKGIHRIKQGTVPIKH